MNPSLSLIVPVFNGETWLADRMSQLLDVLSDVRSSFEVWMIDDGSTDGTTDLAIDWAHAYPQVHLLQLREHHGWLYAARWVLPRCRGQFVVIYNPLTRMSHREFSQLWSMRSDDELVLARSQPQGSASELMRLLIAADISAADRAPAMPPGLLMLRRATWDELIAERIREAGRTRETGRGPTVRPAEPRGADRLTRTDLRDRPLGKLSHDPLPLPHWLRSTPSPYESQLPGTTFYG